MKRHRFCSFFTLLSSNRPLFFSRRTDPKPRIRIVRTETNLNRGAYSIIYQFIFLMKRVHLWAYVINTATILLSF